MEVNRNSILAEFLVALVLSVAGFAAGPESNGPGSLVIEAAGAGQNAFYLTNGKKLLIESSDEGLLFYRDGTLLIEPPLNVVASLYERRFDENENGLLRSASDRRRKLLKNPRYLELFVEKNEKPVTSLEVGPNGIFEVIGDKKYKIVSVFGGRLMAEDSVLIAGRSTKSYRSLHPDVLKTLTDRYATAPQNYAAILSNKNNLKDLEWRNRFKPLASPILVAAPAPIEPKTAASPEAVVPSTHQSEKKASSEPPIRPRSPTITGKVKTKFPNWVKSYSERVAYLNMIEQFPTPKPRLAHQDGLPPEYNALRNAMEAHSTELSRLLGAGAPEKAEDLEIDAGRKNADSIHRFWAKYLQEKEGVHNLTDAEKARYDADLEDFEHVVIGARYQKLYTEFLDKKIAAHEAKHGPPTSMFRNITVSAKQDQALQELALLQVMKEFKSNPAEYRETKARISALARVPADGNPHSLKYPKLNLFLWQTSADDFLGAVVGGGGGE